MNDEQDDILSVPGAAVATEAPAEKPKNKGGRPAKSAVWQPAERNVERMVIATYRHGGSDKQENPLVGSDNGVRFMLTADEPTLIPFNVVDALRRDYVVSFQSDGKSANKQEKRIRYNIEISELDERFHTYEGLQEFKEANPGIKDALEQAKSARHKS